MKKLKIGLFIDNWYPNIDGVIVVVENLCKNLSKYADITLVVPDNNDNKKYPFNVIRIDSIKVFNTDYRLSLVDINYIKLKHIFKDMDFDIIHIHSPFAIGRLGIRIAKEKHIPVIATMHTRWEYEFLKYTKSKITTKLIINHLIKSYNKCYSCISLNKSLIKVYNNYGYKGKYTIINNGTDLKIVDNKEESLNRINKLYKLKDNDFVLLFVGRIVSIKNIFFILDALKILKDKGFNFKMIYVGDGPDFNALKKKIIDYKLNNDIILTGKIMDRELLKQIYYRANLFLFPSLFDSSSLVQIEAASQETPTIFIEGSVTSDTVDNNINGFTTENDINKFASRIEEIYNNKTLYNKVKENAKKDLAKSWEEISKETYNYYLEVIDEYNKL